MKMLSYQEKKAKIVNLDSDIIFVKGKNHVGKSCILKSLYHTLGAEVKKMPIQWAKANVILVLHFTIDTINFKSLLIGNDIYVYNPNGEIRFKEKLNSPALYKELNSLFGINIFIDKNMKEHIPAGAIYMPFYIDQDSGWDETWSSFAKIGNSSDRTNLRQYFTSIVDETYFSKKKELSSIISRLHKVTSDIKAYHILSFEIERDLKRMEVDLSITSFEKNITSYLTHLTKLREDQKETIRLLQSLYTKKTYTELNIKQLKRNIKDMQKDFNYAMQLENIVTCPTCGSQYRNNMLSRHEILKDEHICKDMVISYQLELDSIEKQISVANENLEKLNSQIIETQSIIKSSQNNVTLEEVIDSRLKDRIDEIVLNKNKQLQHEQQILSQKKIEIEAIINNYENGGRKELIEKDFKKKVIDGLKFMGVNPNEEKIKYGNKISSTGSSQPINIVAYSFAYYYIMQKYGGPLFFPIVIDEPRQQGLTKEGLSKMINYMLKNIPKNGQLILSIADESIELPSTAYVIDLLEMNSVLNKAEFESVKKEVEELLDKDFFRFS